MKRMDKPQDPIYGYKLNCDVKKKGHTVLMPKHVDSALYGMLYTTWNFLSAVCWNFWHGRNQVIFKERFIM
ncbi:hypothetical protein MKW92_005221 [Papaver armeniacum]|nr:hypothetical protein MKW92_005221 [Papaver armeniacum]